MENSKLKTDMLEEPIWNKLIQYALPVAATGILEQLFNASDIAIVRNFTGEAKTVADRQCYPCAERGIKI